MGEKTQKCAYRIGELSVVSAWVFIHVDLAHGDVESAPESANQYS